MTKEDVIVYCVEYRQDYIETNDSEPSEITLTQAQHDLIDNPTHVLGMLVVVSG